MINIRLVVSACVIAFGAVSLATAGPLEEADAAFESGEHARALARYDDVLASEPNNLRALVRSARLLSWDNHFEAALERYGRARAVAPDDRDAALGEATVLAWAHRLTDSVAAFQALLARRPDDAEARLGLARALSWRGDYTAARDEYARLLAREPSDVPALVGTAQTYAWAGKLRQARPWYERALAADPTNKDAAVGLAYVDLWSGELGPAERQASALSSRLPEDQDVRALSVATRQATAPWVRAQSAHVSDTDDNDLDVTQLAAGWALPGNFWLTGGYGHYDLSDASGEARIDSLLLTAGYRPARGQSLELSAGRDRAEKTTGERFDTTIGGLGWAWGLDGPWQVRVSASRDVLRYSPTITDHEIVLDEAAVSTSGRIGPRWLVRAGFSAADYSDDNRRRVARAGCGYRLPLRRPAIEVGYGARWIDFDADLDGGYFDPQDYVSHLAYVHLSGEVGRRKVTWALDLDGGVQSFTLGGVDTNDDTVLIASGTFGFPLGRGFVLELFGNHSDYAGQTAAGFESDEAGLRLRWRGGS
ncbi:MAG TPA: tetratricopeptide repeat protein [Candidatus Polarisedimenticolaceae bacterium]|nr:tetratricopeptide repeat protein [Candidatus Polarisedimenticolaceae bacterium]